MKFKHSDISLKTVLVVFPAVFLITGCAGIERRLFDCGVAVERYRSGLVFKTMRVDGRNIAFLERKGYGDTIVLIHGFGADKDAWLRFIRYLPQDYHVFSIDLPGHGDSPPDMDLSYDIQHLADAFSRMVDALKLCHFHLAGHSLGGYVAMLYAAQNPQKPVSLGLFASAGVLCPRPTDFQLALEKGNPPITIDSAKSFDRMLDRVFYEKPFVPWPLRQVIVRRCIKRNKFEKKMWKDIWKNHPDAKSLMARIRVPVLLLWGDRDRIMDISCVKVYQRCLPRAEAVVIKNCGHGLIFEKPKQAAAAYAKFIGKLL